MSSKLGCYCGSSKEFLLCCGEFYHSSKIPVSAEKLMRSRYSAFASGNFDYLIATHDPVTRNEFDLLANKKWAISVQFTKLEVLKVKEHGTKATVEFRAHYLAGGKAEVHHEVSNFRKIAGKWFYVAGKHIL